MRNFSETHFILPKSLRKELSEPVGELVAGTIEETIPILKKKLVPHSNWLVAVGDVTANLFVENGFEPNIIITDGQTKRGALEEWKDWDGFEVLHARCPPAEITPEAWSILIEGIKLCKSSKDIHIKIDGEEDLLVLPLIIELPLNSIIVYGQPNAGAVIRIVTEEARAYAKEIIGKMDRK